MLRSLLIVAGAASFLTACASTRATKAASSPAETPPAPAAAAPAPTATSTASPAQASNLPHRQYFDKRKRRFYYFDPAKKQYFWETGEPKT